MAGGVVQAVGAQGAAMTRRPLIYVAGPYTSGDPVLNVRLAIEVAEDVEALGADVVIPHLSMLWHLVSPATVQRWYERDNAVLVRCDAVVRIDGVSVGADAEVALAVAEGIPVFSEEDVANGLLRGWIVASQ